MYPPPLSNSVLYYNGYYHPKPAAITPSALSRVLQHDIHTPQRPRVGPEIQSQHPEAHSNDMPRSQQPYLDPSIQAQRLLPFQNVAQTPAEVQRQLEEKAYQKQLKKREAFAKRRAELRKDPSALLRHYTEYMTQFPLRKDERPNPYYMGLLANQEMPNDRLSDRTLAIAYAKKHWQNAWEDKKDYKYVVRLVREAKEKDREKERQEVRELAGKRRSNVSRI